VASKFCGLGPCVGANTIIMEIIHKEKLNNTFEYY